MSMIEKFLKEKDALREGLVEVKEKALKAAEAEADEMIDTFINVVKAMVANASDEEFVAFITSGKLDDEDIAAAIVFRAEAAKLHDEKERDENHEKHGRRVRVVVLG